MLSSIRCEIHLPCGHMEDICRRQSVSTDDIPCSLSVPRRGPCYEPLQTRNNTAAKECRRQYSPAQQSAKELNEDVASGSKEQDGRDPVLEEQAEIGILERSEGIQELTGNGSLAQATGDAAEHAVEMLSSAGNVELHQANVSGRDSPGELHLSPENIDTQLISTTRIDEFGGKYKKENQMLAAVDMGTNSFHMVVVRADCQGGFQIVDAEKENVRLGTGSAGMRLVTPEAEERALAAIKRFKILAETYQAPMRVVATAAVREAKNKGMFLRNILEKAGVEVEVLSGKEEANLIYLGVLQALDVYDKTVLTVDIGGGSTEFVVGRAGKPLYTASLKLGHILLTENFIGNGDEPIRKNQIDDLRRHVSVSLADSGTLEKIHTIGFELAIGSSGTIETIEQVINQGHAFDMAAQSEIQPQTILHDYRDREFSYDELGIIVRKLCKAKNNEQRAKLLGLPERRKDVLLAGAILLEEIFQAMCIRRMRVSPYALREGVIVDTLARTYDKFQPNPNLRWSSVVNLARRFISDTKLVSAVHSTKLAKEILTGLKTCKSGRLECISEVALVLNDTDTELMAAAATLHHIGMCIGHKDYHKHSHYIIKNNQHLSGYSPIEVEVIALLAKYHRKKTPSMKDDDFAKLPDDVQKKVKVMCAIIRISIALDRCNSGSIERVHVTQDNDQCLIVVVPSMDRHTGKPVDVSFELWAAQDKLEYFKKIFKRKASIVIADDDDVTLLEVEQCTNSRCKEW